MKFVQGSASKKGRVLLRPTEDQAAYHVEHGLSRRERTRLLRAADRAQRGQVQVRDLTPAKAPAPSTRKEIEMEVNLIANRHAAFVELQAFVTSDPADQGLVWRLPDGALTPIERAARIALLEAHSPKELTNALLRNGTDFGLWVDSTANLPRQEFCLECWGGEVVTATPPGQAPGIVTL